MSPVRSVTYVSGPDPKNMAERVGFEPTVRFPVRSLSRRVLSTAQSPLRGHTSHGNKGFRSRAIKQKRESTAYRLRPTVQDRNSCFLRLAPSAGQGLQDRSGPARSNGAGPIHLRDAKKDCRMAAQSSARTPEATST